MTKKPDCIIQGNLERSVGLYAEFGIFQDGKKYFGEKKVGKYYYEACGAIAKNKYCTGRNSNDDSLYARNEKAKFGSKALGLKISEGEQNTRDLKKPMPVMEAEAPSKKGVIIFMISKAKVCFDFK